MTATLVRSPEELDPLERLGLIDMSYSRFDTYQMCPSKYFYTYILKEPRPFAPAAALGNIIHGVLELAAPDMALAELLMLMEDQRARYDPERKIEPKLIKAGFQILIDYVDRHVGQEPDVLGREAEFRLVVGPALVLGYIDRVERGRDQVVRVSDFKTGVWEDRGPPVENLQLGLYALAASRMWESPGGIYSELYYLRSGHRKGHLFTPNDLEVVAARLHELVETIVEDRFFHATDNARTCARLCDFGKNGTCGVGKARLRGGSNYS